MPYATGGQAPTPRAEHTAVRFADKPLLSVHIPADPESVYLCSRFADKARKPSAMVILAFDKGLALIPVSNIAKAYKTVLTKNRTSVILSATDKERTKEKA